MEGAIPEQIITLKLTQAHQNLITEDALDILLQPLRKKNALLNFQTPGWLTYARATSCKQQDSRGNDEGVSRSVVRPCSPLDDDCRGAGVDCRLAPAVRGPQSDDARTLRRNDSLQTLRPSSRARY